MYGKTEQFNKGGNKMTSVEYLMSKKITPVIKVVEGSNKAEAFVTMTIEQFEEYGKHCTEKPLPTDEKTVCPECLKKCTNEELRMFGGLCEECSTDFN